MKTRTFGSLEAVVTGGTDREGGGDGPVVVLLHGFGAPGTDLVPLWRVLDVPREVRFVFPAAPIPLAMGMGFESRAWWMIDMAAYDRAVRTGEYRDLSRTIPDGLADARQKVNALLDAVEKELNPSSLVLGGFSQGAMLSLDVALRGDRALAGLIVFSGTLLAREEWLPLLTKRAGLRVVQSHGRQDPILPFALAEELKGELEKAGAVVRWVPFQGAHEIPPPALEAATDLLRML
ncbi:MAG: dienelactone hydrolase family protein [Polyangiales bacterium]|nr:dienelactone hydrolase family protein [Myxococcales bacterium]